MTHKPFECRICQPLYTFLAFCYDWSLSKPIRVRRRKYWVFFCIINTPNKPLTWNYNVRGNQKLRSFSFLSYFVKPLFNFIIFSNNNVRWNLFHVYKTMSTENILFSNFWLYSSLCFITTLIKGLWLCILLK